MKTKLFSELTTSDKWNIRANDFEILASPRPELFDYISQVTKQLAEKLANSEQDLIIQSLPTTGINRMIQLCEAELQRRSKT